MARELAKTVEQVEQDTVFKSIPESQLDVEQKSVDKRSEPKELVVEQDGEFGLYVIRFTAGGELPDSLKGKWTNIHIAQAAIENYKAMQAKQA